MQLSDACMQPVACNRLQFKAIVSIDSNAKQLNAIEYNAVDLNA